MRLEDKELEGPDLEREHRLEELHDETHERDKQLPELAGPEVVEAGPAIVDAEHASRTRMFDALRAILAGENLTISMLYLPPREAMALEALQSAVTGRDAALNTFLYAEDRASLLEQALAVLQQNLTRGDAGTLAALQLQYDALTEHVAELRDELRGLEDAQDDLIEQKPRDLKTSGDAPETADGEGSPSFLAAALDAVGSTLTGPERPEAPRPASTLDGSPDGPEVVRERPPSTLAGPELPAPPPHVSLLDAPGREAIRPEHVTALDGPEVVREARPSTLYTEGVDELLVPAHHRPRASSVENAVRGPESSSGDARPAGSVESAAREPRRSDDPGSVDRAPRDGAIENRGAAREPAPSSVESEPARPAGRRGLSVRSTDKPPGKKR